MGWVPIICEWCDYSTVSNAALTISASVRGKMKQWSRLLTVRSEDTSQAQLPSSLNFALHIFTCLCACTHDCHDVSVKARGQPVSVSSLLLLCGFQELNSGHRVFQQAPLADEPSCQSSNHLIIIYWLQTIMGLCQCIIFPASPLLTSNFYAFSHVCKIQ